MILTLTLTLTSHLSPFTLTLTPYPGLAHAACPLAAARAQGLRRQAGRRSLLQLPLAARCGATAGLSPSPSLTLTLTLTLALTLTLTLTLTLCQVRGPHLAP